MALCTCGREIRPSPHCPRCGSTNVYVRKSAAGYLDTPAGRVKAQGFCCRKCGIDFHEGFNCEAPPTAQVSGETFSKFQESKAAATEKIKSSMPNRRAIEDAILEAGKLARKKKADDEKEDSLEDLLAEGDKGDEDSDGKKRKAN